MIESLNNDKIKELSKLNNKKYRKIHNKFLAPGKHLVEEAIKNNLVEEIFILNGETNNYNHQVTYVSPNVMKKLTQLDTPPKEAALCKIPSKNQIKGNIIILDDIKDPGNLGTIIRSAVAFNYQTLILSKECVDIYNPKVIRATEGMIFNINIIIEDLNIIIEKLKQENYKIYATDVAEGKKPTPCESKHAIIIGSEATGVKEKIKNKSDYKIKLPMNNLCESLNAGVSASILMYVIGGEQWKI